MPAQIIDGKAIAASIHAENRQRVVALHAQETIPHIAFVRVGDDPASELYVRMKEKAAASLGMISTTHVLGRSSTQHCLLELIRQLNEDPAVHGILVQAPLPRHLDEASVFSAIDPRKDVDGFHPLNAGKLLLGQSPLFTPCTPAGIHQLLVRTGIPINGAEIVILGRGNIVGKPMAAILLQKSAQANATVTLLHSQSRDIPAHCRRADIIIAAMGQAEFLKGDMLKPGAVVIDVGVNQVPDSSTAKGTRTVGDVDFREVSKIAGYITPNPGGVGPMTIAMLLSNTLKAAENTAQRLTP